jgi:hypothetical protein
MGRFKLQALARWPRVGGVCLLLGTGLSAPVMAQHPSRTGDALYQGESARRVFFDGYAVGTELYCCARALNAEGGPTSSGLFGLPIGLRFHLTYALSDVLDVGTVLNASSGSSGGNMSLDWIMLKYYQAADEGSYAVRLAVDPSLDGSLGFPQIDLALLTSSPLSPVVAATYALGVRRVRAGYERWTPLQNEEPNETLLITNTPQPRFEITYLRAFGWELHLMMQYALLLNPARSNVFIGMTGSARYYTLMESARETREIAAGKRNQEAPVWEGTYNGGILWMRGGVEYNRPSYQVSPFLGLPLLFWSSETDESPPGLLAGLRLTLR